MKIALIIIGVVILAALLLFALPAFVVGYRVYRKLLVRTSKDKWKRGSNWPDDYEYSQMFAKAGEWFEEHKDKMTPVEVESDGFKLAGEYFDFGADKCAFIISGRPETVLYSYFFAKPYEEMGYNILVIDNRCHGLSEGKYFAVGQREYVDVIKWCELLHDELGNKTIFLHGVCVGSANALYAFTRGNAPDYVVGMAAEGMYATFAESIKTHMIAENRPLFPFFSTILFWTRKLSKVDIYDQGPFYEIGKMDRPILFLHSRADIFSTAVWAEKIYNKCSAPKRIEWFNESAHSRSRYTYEEQYDNAIKNFLEELV